MSQNIQIDYDGRYYCHNCSIQIEFRLDELSIDCSNSYYKNCPKCGTTNYITYPL